MSKREWLFTALSLALALVLIEVFLQAGYLALKGRFVWQREDFRVGDYVERVEDERYMTARRGYRNAALHDKAAPWEIAIDMDGFRVAANASSRDAPNIAFIGDSVPFGYGVDGRDSVPSLLQEILRRRGDPRGVINAALPSYSLDQAVHRYKYELSGRFDIDVVVLQIYDPASQFMLLGRDWDVGKNWVTFPGRNPNRDGLLRYSALWHLASYAGVLLRLRTERLDVDDRVAIDKYVASINRSLEVLRGDTEGRVRSVMILPVTPPPKTWAGLTRPHRVAVTILNDTLRAFASRHAYIRFVDTNALFAGDRDDSAFIDECCHLSRRGAERVAELLAAHLPPQGESPPKSFTSSRTP